MGTTSSLALGVAAATALLSGCGTYSREVTPWLRTTREVPFRLLAESGGVGGHDVSRAERKERGRWVTVPGLGDGAFAFAGGSRAVVIGSSPLLLRPDGSTAPLPCGGELRGTPDGAELVCVEIFGRRATEGPPETVRVTRLDGEGRAVGRREVLLPVRVPANEPILGARVGTSLLGFAPEGPVFAVLSEQPHESYAAEAVKMARAFVLRGDDRWQELGALRITVGELWALHFPRLWNERLGWHLELGRILRDARGEPDP